MVESNQRLNAVSQQFIDQLIVEVQPFFVDFPVAVRDYSGPADGKTIGFDAVLLHQCDVFPEAMINVTGDVFILGSRLSSGI